MEAAFSNDFRRVFLLTFTKELIRHSEKRDIITLQKIIESKGEKIPRERSQVPETFFTREMPVRKMNEPLVQKEIKKTEIPVLRKPQIRQLTQPVPRPLFIPEPKLPEHLEYLKPVPTAGVEIDLFKINPLIKDPGVRIIEANPEERVVVIGAMGTKPTDIILSKEDIDRIINTFSESSKIPTTEGIYKVVVGNLILSAIISETIGSRFTIKKMVANASPISQQKPLPLLPFQNNNLR